MVMGETSKEEGSDVVQQKDAHSSQPLPFCVAPQYLLKFDESVFLCAQHENVHLTDFIMSTMKSMRQDTVRRAKLF